MGFAGQGYGGKHTAAARFNIALQVRQCTAHANKVVDHNVLLPGLNLSGESGLSCQSRKTVGARMPDEIGLNDPAIHRPTKRPTEFVRKNLRNGIDAFALEGMRADQGCSPIIKQALQGHHFSRTQCRLYQHHRRHTIAGLGRWIGGMLLDGRFSRMNQHIGEIMPRRSWWMHAVDLNPCPTFLAT